MKNLISIFILFFPLVLFAEYSGVHIEFEIQLNDGNKIHGYKYLVHGTNTEEFKKHLEENPQIYLQNLYTFEQGEYGYYKRRLKYAYQKSSVFQLIEPSEISLNKIKSVVIKELILASYAIQIVGDYEWNDRLWLNSEPIIKYSEDEGMCSYDIFIHKNGNIPNEVMKKIKFIIRQIDGKIEIRETEFEIKSDLEYQERMKDLYEERSRLLKPIFKKYENLKIVNISMCTC